MEVRRFSRFEAGPKATDSTADGRSWRKPTNRRSDSRPRSYPYQDLASRERQFESYTERDSPSRAHPDPTALDVLVDPGGRRCCPEHDDVVRVQLQPISWDVASRTQRGRCDLVSRPCCRCGASPALDRAHSSRTSFQVRTGRERVRLSSDELVRLTGRSSRRRLADRGRAW